MDEARKGALRRAVAWITRDGEDMGRLTTSRELAHDLRLDRHCEEAGLVDTGALVWLRGSDGLVEHLCPRRNVWLPLIDFNDSGEDG